MPWLWVFTIACVFFSIGVAMGELAVAEKPNKLFYVISLIMLGLHIYVALAWLMRAISILVAPGHLA